jgi:hypothetical protein
MQIAYCDFLTRAFSALISRSSFFHIFLRLKKGKVDFGCFALLWSLSEHQYCCYKAYNDDNDYRNN